MNLLRLALPVIVLAVLAFAGACRGSGGLSLEKYFKRLDEIDNRSGERTDALQSQFDLISDETRTDQERIDAAQSTFPEFATIVDEFFESVDKLEPPKEARENHQEAVDARKPWMPQRPSSPSSMTSAQMSPGLNRSQSLTRRCQCSIAPRPAPPIRA